MLSLRRWLGATPPVFNNSKCPAFWELQACLALHILSPPLVLLLISPLFSWVAQAPHVATDFDFDRDVPGYYYELAFHDLTQRPLCPSAPRCITSEKAVQTHTDGVRYVNDTWDLQCFGHPYPQTLLFNRTEHNGYLRGYVPTTLIPFLPKGIVSSLVFPDTIVDFKSGPGGWLLELQCVEAFGVVKFVGINFYSKLKTEVAFNEMYAAAMARGLGLWMNSKLWGLSRVNHTDCPNEPHVQSGETLRTVLS